MRALIWLALIGAGVLAAPSLRADDKAQLAAVQACRQEPAPLLRLDCYDNALANNEIPVIPQPALAGAAWQRAMTQERQRDDHSTTFLVTDSGGDNPLVVLTTPAIGVPPPRPVLMFSCVDNITRLQVALMTPVRESDGTVLLATERSSVNVGWFVRENGFLLESSRGLAGIEEIRQLFGAQRLTLTPPGASTRLTFNITGLAQEIEPLRNACHW
ncbi:type VI secretion system-associated protein VasI [Enterobacillus tribolii]|uniref:Type VI secretion system protein VasI n=1 Tax=Enterobacillus tribolii TaxID=1487935 RepID=A0A370QHB8_9GAMM|nr:type VI secretion system-associated protein VasI [Enterobacillus tribolii]MBW7982466.1 type VI secretion system-associated protein TagO [Enterobacillus tribolii]RDK87745.1 type VI secretion system protein VasI [Enterobacillus tribolii]